MSVRFLAHRVLITQRRPLVDDAVQPEVASTHKSANPTPALFFVRRDLDL